MTARAAAARLAVAGLCVLPVVGCHGALRGGIRPEGPFGAHRVVVAVAGDEQGKTIVERAWADEPRILRLIDAPEPREEMCRPQIPPVGTSAAQMAEARRRSRPFQILVEVDTRSAPGRLGARFFKDPCEAVPLALDVPLEEAAQRLRAMFPPNRRIKLAGTLDGGEAEGVEEGQFFVVARHGQGVVGDVRVTETRRHESEIVPLGCCTDVRPGDTVARRDRAIEGDFVAAVAAVLSPVDQVPMLGMAGGMRARVEGAPVQLGILGSGLSNGRDLVVSMAFEAAWLTDLHGWSVGPAAGIGPVGFQKSGATAAATKVSDYLAGTIALRVAYTGRHLWATADAGWSQPLSGFGDTETADVVGDGFPFLRVALGLSLLH